MTHPFQSIRWRLLLWHSLISLALVVAIGLLANRLSSRDRFERIDHELRNHERSFFRSVFMSSSGEKSDSSMFLRKAEVCAETSEGLRITALPAAKAYSRGLMASWKG